MEKATFKTVLCCLLFLLLKKEVLGNILPIYPPNGEVIENFPVNFKWENTDTSQEYIYRHEHSTGYSFELSMAIEGLKNTEVVRGLQNEHVYYWRVRYHPKGLFEGTYGHISDIFVFGLNREIPEDILARLVREEEPKIPKEEEKKVESEFEEEIIHIEKLLEGKTEVKVVKEIVDENMGTPIVQKLAIKKTSPAKSETQNEFDWNVSSSVNSTSVLGAVAEEGILCKFKYLENGSNTEKIFCDIPKLELKEQSIYPFGDEYSIIISGNLIQKFNIQIDIYDCDFDIFKPKTWFRCKEKFVESKILEVSPNMFFRIYEGSNRVPILSYSLNADIFNILAGHAKSSKDIKMVHTYRIINSRFNLNFEEDNEYLLTLTNYDSNDGEKPFIFPFEEIIGVTQWYGYTEYQSPHTGIDLGAYKENILAVEDGEVISKGWDSYYGECLSGGNYVKIKQSNGMYTVYFHLEDIFVNTGDSVKKGDLLGRSGNSGAWNCQKLAYHLHFETRLNSSSSSHINPVKYIATDWNNVLTLGYLTYPGRLSGENPHPGR